MTVSGLVFDFGGVIWDARRDLAADLEREHGLEAGSIYRTLYDSDEWRQARVGKGEMALVRESAHRRLEALAGRPLPPLHQVWSEAKGLIDQNVSVIRSLRPLYKTAVLSNAAGRVEARLVDLGLRGLFDVVVDSAVLGLAKPDHEIYRLTAQRLELPPAECLFVDDNEPNVAAAREVGMAALLYRHENGDNLAHQLAEFGVKPPQ